MKCQIGIEPNRIRFDVPKKIQAAQIIDSQRCHRRDGSRRENCGSDELEEVHWFVGARCYCIQRQLELFCGRIPEIFPRDSGFASILAPILVRPWRTTRLTRPDGIERYVGVSKNAEKILYSSFLIGMHAYLLVARVHIQIQGGVLRECQFVNCVCRTGSNDGDDGRQRIAARRIRVCGKTVVNGARRWSPVWPWLFRWFAIAAT